jgi:hypothetical protein
MSRASSWFSSKTLNRPGDIASERQPDEIAVKNAAFVRRVQCVGNLARQPHGFVSSRRTADRFPLEILEDEVIGSDIVDLANVWMVDRGNGARLALKSARIVSNQPLDRDRAIQALIVRLVDLAHTSRADQRLDRVWAEPRAGSQDLWDALTGRKEALEMERATHCLE